LGGLGRGGAPPTGGGAGRRGPGRVVSMTTAAARPARLALSCAVAAKQLLVVALAALALVLVAWVAKAGLWRRGRLFLVAVALVVALGVLARRIGLGELLVLAVVVLIPLLVVPAPRAPSRRR